MKNINNNQQELVQYLQQQIRTTNERSKRFTHSIDGKEYPRRDLFVKLQCYINDFLAKKSGTKMIVMPGFRGVGKTTLMAQLCTSCMSKVDDILFLSIEDAVNLFGAGIAELMAAYEQILGSDLESILKPMVIFLDEIQNDPKWAVSLKSLFEKTTNIFFCCTGSSAVTLQATPNLARRAIFEKLPPMSFTEYEMIQNGIEIPLLLKEKIKHAVYFSLDAKAAYTELLQLQSAVNQYWTNINRKDVGKYLAYGTLPFALVMPNETAVYDSISLLLDKIIKIDLPTLGNFDNNTLGAIKKLLFVIAENDVTSLGALEERFKINRLTIASIFDALEKAELLIKIPAYGSNMTVAKKANKYLFMSPAIRMAFFYITGQNSTYLVRQGKLLEDSYGSHLYREFMLNGLGAIRYDSEQGGADFILQIQNNKQLIIEIGMGGKDRKQILSSMKKITSDYNLILSGSELSIDQELTTVSVPLDYYFLM